MPATVPLPEAAVTDRVRSWRAEHGSPGEAGAVRFVVEARDLVDEIRRNRPDEVVDEESLQFNDFGASLHVYGASDDVEYLRFDCFDKEPHYHYIKADEGANVI